MENYIKIDKINKIIKDIKKDTEWINDSHTQSEYNGIIDGLNQLKTKLKI
jgi:hypothetical protein